MFYVHTILVITPITVKYTHGINLLGCTVKRLSFTGRTFRGFCEIQIFIREINFHSQNSKFYLRY